MKFKPVKGEKVINVLTQVAVDKGYRTKPLEDKDPNFYKLIILGSTVEDMAIYRINKIDGSIHFTKWGKRLYFKVDLNLLANEQAVMNWKGEKTYMSAEIDRHMHETRPRPVRFYSSDHTPSADTNAYEAEEQYIRENNPGLFLK